MALGQEGPAGSPGPRSLKEVLQLRLQNRRSREQLAQQGIMPPLKGLPYVIEQRSCLDRGKNEDSLKHKTQSHIHQPDLVQANALEDAVTDPTETEQKRARLADDLSEKILCRPGPLELLEKNILPLHPSAEQGVKAGNWQSPEPEARTECGSGGQVSPQQPGHHQSQGGDTPPRQPAGQSMQTPPGTVPRFELVAAVPEGGAMGGGSVQPGQDTDQTPPTLQVTPIVMVPPRGAEPPRPPRPRKVKEVKRKVRKLKYHQYVPPDQRAERGPVPLDAAYSRLLQQQQLCLQLQILSRQHLGPGMRPEPLVGFAGPVPTQLPCVPLSPLPRSLTTGAAACSPKPELLPANLDDLTVSELRQQLRKRGLPVSGTKPALLERLKPYQISGPKLAPPPPGPRPGPPPPAPAPAPDEQALLEKQKVIERLAWKLRQEQRQARGPDRSPGSVALPLPSSSSSSSSPHFPHPGFPESRPSTPTSPGNPFLFPSANIPTSANTTEVKPLSPRRQPRAGSPLQDSGVCDTLESQAVPTEFCLSPASLHSFFPMEDVDFDARHDSRSEETFDSGVLLSSSLGPNTRELGSVEALDNPGTGGFQSLEEELTEAIRSAELSQTPSIEEILDEPLVSTGPRAGTDPDSPGSPPAAVRPLPRTLAEDSALPPALDLLPNPSHCRPFEPLSPPSPAPSLGVRCPSTGSPEIALDPADWLEALPGAGSLAQTSAFSVDFLEVPDLNVSRMIDLLVDQW